MTDGKVKWGVIGAGGISSRTIPDGILAADNIELVGIADLYPERAAEYADRFNCNAYADVEELVSDPNIEAVYLGTPPFVHAEHAILAAKHGKHVLSEKPMATSATEAKAMVDACNENGVLLGHGTMMRFNASHAKMKEKIDAGELGKLLSVHGIYSVYWDPGVPKDTGKDKDILDLEQGEGRQLAWRQISRLSGGGPMADDGIHAIDTMVYLMGHVAEVASFTDTLTRDRDIEDTATVVLKFESGAQGLLECYSSVPNFKGRRSLRVMGDKGVLLSKETLGPPMMVADDGTITRHNRLFQFRGFTGEAHDEEMQPEEIYLDHVMMYKKQFGGFSDAIRGKSSYRNLGDEGLHSMRVLEAALTASKERRFVTIEK